MHGLECGSSRYGFHLESIYTESLRFNSAVSSSRAIESIDAFRMADNAIDERLLTVLTAMTCVI